MMGDRELPLERLILAFREEEFRRYVRGFIMDSRRLLEEMEPSELHLIADYVPGVFWKKLKESGLHLYAVDGLMEYQFSFSHDPGETSLVFAEDLLVLNSLFWERYGRRSFRKANRMRPGEDYYLAFGAFFYRLSYVQRGSSIYRLMNLYYRPVVRELRELKGGRG
ncbi:MAG: hypothetical protein DRI93_01410 [Aquificota bacterium]|nr:MAG: hypothetical protein DRI93_01410 [Aquificota bacterium]